MRNARTTVIKVEPLAERWLRVTFADGAIHEVDLAQCIASGGVFAPIRDDRSTFERVSVDEFGTVVFPGDIDLDPDVLRGDAVPAGGSEYPRRVVQAA